MITDTSISHNTKEWYADKMNTVVNACHIKFMVIMQNEIWEQITNNKKLLFSQELCLSRFCVVERYWGNGIAYSNAASTALRDEYFNRS